MLFLLFSVLIFITAFFGVGVFISNFLKLQFRESFSLNTFLGICISSLFFSILQFFTPLNTVILCCFLLVGGFGVIFWLRKKTNDYKNLTSCKSFIKTNYFIIITDILFLLTISIYFCSYNEITAGDTLLYHSSLVSWLNYSKIVPGLANLHYRLGMNSAYLILAAGIDTGIFDKYSSTILPTIFLFLTLRYFFELIINNKISKNAKMMVVILAVWAMLACIISPNLYYDFSSMIFTTIIFIELLLKYEEKSIETAVSFDILFIFAAMSFAIKQNGAVMVFAVFCLGTVELVKNKKTVKDFSKFIAIPVLFGITYIIRNIIQTGYPLYPLPIFGLSLKWTSKENTQDLLDAIKYWARLPGPDFMKAKTNGISFWFLPWLKMNIENNLMYFLVILFAIVFTIKNFFLLKNQRKQLIHFLTMMSIISANIIFWFISAPDFRFGSAFFFILLAITCYYARAEKSTYILLIILAVFILQTLGFYWRMSVSILSKKNDTCINVLCCLIIGYFLYTCFYKTKNQRIIACLLLFFVLYNPHNGNLRKKTPVKMTQLPVQKVKLLNGQNPPLEVYIPISDGLTGDAPLPCTPFQNDKLKLIEPGNLKSGFYLKE